MRTQLKQLSGDTAIYGVSTIVQRFLSFLLTPFYTHYLLRAELGVQTDLFVLVGFFLILANAGMESSFFKFDSIAEGERGKREVLWNALGINWGVALLLGGVLIFFPEVLRATGISRVPSEYDHLIQAAGAILALDSMAMIPLALFRMRRKAKKFGLIKIAAITVNVLGNIIFVGFMGMKLEGIFLAGILQSIVQLLLVLPAIIRLRPITFNPVLRRMMLSFGLPTVGSGLSMIALQLVDRIVIERLVGFDGLGLYQANYRLGIVMVVLVSVFEFAWRPFFLQQAGEPNARELFSRVFTYFNLVAGGLLLLVAFFIPNIAAFPIPFTDGSHFINEIYWGGLSIVPIVLAAYLFNGWYTNFIAGVYIEKKTRSLLFLTGAGVVVEVLLCLFLVPIIGIAGGAWATLAAYLTMSTALFVYIRRYYEVPYEWGRVMIILGTAGALLGLNLLLFDFRDISWSTAAFRFGLFLLYPVVLFAAGFFSGPEIVMLRGLLSRFGRRG